MERHTRLRTVLKATSWRVVATLSTVLLALALTGSAATAVRVGVPDFVLKLGVFYVHERAWLLPWPQSLGAYRLAGKMVSWKLLAMGISMAVTAWMTGSLAVALKLGPVDSLLKTLTFYLHERLWGGIAYGRSFGEEEAAEEEEDGKRK